jgi:hypothetical protein
VVISDPQVRAGLYQVRPVVALVVERVEEIGMPFLGEGAVAPQVGEAPVGTQEEGASLVHHQGCLARMISLHRSRPKRASCSSATRTWGIEVRGGWSSSFRFGSRATTLSAIRSA